MGDDKNWVRWEKEHEGEKLVKNKRPNCHVQEKTRVI